MITSMKNLVRGKTNKLIDRAMKLHFVRHLWRERDAQQITCQAQAKQQHSLATQSFCLPQRVCPVQSFMHTEEFGNIAEFNQLRVPVFCDLDAKHEQRIFQAQGGHVCGTQGYTLQTSEQVVQVQRARKILAVIRLCRSTANVPLSSVQTPTPTHVRSFAENPRLMSKCCAFG